MYENRWEQSQPRVWDHPPQQWEQPIQFQPQAAPPPPAVQTQVQPQSALYHQTQLGPQLYQHTQYQADQNIQGQHLQQVQLQHVYQENQHLQQDQEVGVLLRQQRPPSPQLTTLEGLFYEMLRLNPLAIPFALRSREISRALGLGTTM